MSPKPTITRGSGNVFADIGLLNADEHQMKARIVMGLAAIIEAQELSQTAAAARIGIAQPDLSKILRGNFSGFSLERLLSALRHLGSDVEIKIKARPDSKHEGRLSLMMA
jgi:predicted XRE-type DNA-binding protein